MQIPHPEESTQLLRIDTCTTQPEELTISLAGDFTYNYIPCVEESLRVARETNAPAISLNLKQVAIVDRAAMCYLGRLREQDVELVDCPAYVVRWMEQEFRGCT